MLLGKENFTNAVQLADGDYVVVPAVYHQIHCLVGIEGKLRSNNMSDRYAGHYPQNWAYRSLYSERES